VKKKNKKKEKARSILLEIPRVSDYCRYTNIKAENRENKKKWKIMKSARQFTIWCGDRKTTQLLWGKGRKTTEKTKNINTMQI